MPSTYSLISSTTLSSSTLGFSFTAIPSTFTDLVLRASVRVDNGANVREVQTTFNSVGGTSYSETYVLGDGSSASSSRRSNRAYNIEGSANAAATTANTFSSLEIYIPSYTASQNKPFSSILAQEDNATSANIRAVAGLFRDTTAISSIQLLADGYNWLSGSSFYLYGISKN